MWPILFATYGAVFIAEIVGDKLLYTTGILATRYRPLPIMFGMGIAFMAKMAVAVLLGKAISTLPPLPLMTPLAKVTKTATPSAARTRWRRAGHMQGYALTGYLAFARLKSPLPTDRHPVGSAGRMPMDVAQRRSGFPQPDGIKCAKVEMSKPTT